MKYIVSIILLTSLTFVSCQKEKSEETEKVSQEIASTFDSTALNTTPVEAGDEQSFHFKYKFTPGESFRYRMTSISQTDRSMQTDTSMADFLKQTIIFIINFKTLSIDSDSIAELECTFTSVNLKANANGNEINYQSNSKMDSTERKKFPEYESIVNYPFNVRIGKRGEIVDIYKIDKIVNRFLSMNGLEDSLSAQEKLMAQQDMSNRNIKPLMQQLFREVPAHRMSIDSTWSYKRESIPVVVFQVDYDNIYKIEKLEMLGDDKLAVIDGTIKTKVSGNQNYNEKGIDYKFDKPVSTASGKIYFNLDRGLIQKSRTQTRMENAYRMEMPTPEGPKKASAREVTSNTNVIELL